MTIETVPSFINAAITSNSSKKSSYGKVTGLIEERNEPHFANRIGGAWAALVSDRSQLRILDLEDNGTRVKDMPVKPEMFLSLCQFLLNQACWAARRYIRATQENADQEAIRGITGVDFSQDVAADLGVEPMDITEIVEALDSDFMAMLRLHSIFSTKMDYLQDIEDLHLYADREQEGEVWRIVATADAFEDAQVIMDEVLVKMNERQDKELTHDMTTMDFTEAA
jgi:hypothetical protein